MHDCLRGTSKHLNRRRRCLSKYTFIVPLSMYSINRQSRASVSGMHKECGVRTTTCNELAGVSPPNGGQARAVVIVHQKKRTKKKEKERCNPVTKQKT